MAEKTKIFFQRCRWQWSLLVLIAIIGGVSISLVRPFGARAVTGVALSDTDTTGFGLDGRDFRVVWTADSPAPAGYQFTKIYIVSSTINLTTSNLNTACVDNGGMCQEVGFLNQSSANQFTVPQFVGKDSNGQNWSTSTAYRAWVFVSSTAPAIVSSSAATVTFDNVTDTSAPQIMHAPVHAATENATAVMHATVFDDQTTDVDFAAGTNGASILVAYGSNVGASFSVATGTQVAGNLFSFSVPTSSVPANGGSFQYFMIATDKAGNKRFMCTSPNPTATSSCQSAPFVVNTKTAAALTLSGTINSNGMAVAGVKVFTGGMAGLAATTNGSGQYTLMGLFSNDGTDIFAYKPGYCQNMRFETIGTVNKSGIDMNINPGDCGFYQGGSGGGGPSSGGGSPTVMFSGPPDGMQNVQPSEKIRVGLSQPMNASTVNDNDASDTGSNVYLTSDGSTKVAGSVVWCDNSSSPGCSSLFSQDTNTILFIPATTSTLTTSTPYTLVITEKVTSQGGQSIQGNRTGGGHKISFVTGGGTFQQGQFTFGGSGQFMPPFVKSMTPGPGVMAASNAKITIEFNEPMDSATINTTNIVMVNKGNGQSVNLSSVSLDSNEKRFVTVAPASLSAGDYEVRVKGAVANVKGVSMRPQQDAAQVAFSAFFKSSGSSDSSGPTIYPKLATGATNVPVNSLFEFGFSEPLLFSSVNTTNISLSRGGTAVGVKVKYDSGKNSVYVVPNSVMAPSTAYTITIGSGVTDLAGNAVATTTYVYTMGSADSVAPAFSEARCDDFTCKIFFTEPMNHDTNVDSNFVSSTLNHLNLGLSVSSGPDKIVASSLISYDDVGKVVTVSGLALTKLSPFTLTLSGLTDISGNILPDATFSGKVEDSAQTFGSFGDQGMFGPPKGDLVGGQVGGGEFKPQGFGNFTAEQFAFGTADMAFPFNQSAGQDSNVFQVRFNPAITLQSGDLVVLTFPDGTDISNATLDTLSPFYKNFDQQGSATVTGTAISLDAAARKVTVTLGISGTPGVNDSYTIDLRKIINPTIPKDPSTGGYTVGIKVLRGGTAQVNKTSMPYFIKSGGTNSITVTVCAASGCGAVAGATGNVAMFGGGPAGPLNKTVTLTNGTISSVDGISTTSVKLTNLSDGCYFIGTQPSLTLGSIDYFGQMSPEPICVNGSQSASKIITLSSASGSSAVTTTVKLPAINFGGVDVDIFAGGPGRFVVKTLSGLTTPDESGYNIRLPANGNWFVGIGPAMPKGGTMGRPAALPGVPPAPMEIVVSGLGTGTASVTEGHNTPSGVTFNDQTDTITFSFATADKTISGTVQDGSSSGLANVEVFMHRQGFGAPAFGTTNASGTFSLSVSDYGTYEIGARKDGLPPLMKNIEVRPDGADAGSDPDVYFEGKQITNANPLVLKIKKASYTISGKVLDANSAPISNAPIFAIDTSGNSVPSMSANDGSYTVFVDAGTWTLQAQLPPDKSDTCGTLIISVTVTNANQSSQNITPSVSSCATLRGDVTVAGTGLANVPLFVEEWNSVTNRPVPGGVRKAAGTNSAGAYSVKVANSKTYRVGTWHPDYGELSAMAAVSGDTTADVTVASMATTTFEFTGGTSTMNAFVELKNVSDSTKVIRKQKNGLDSNLQVATVSGATYNYFIDVAGVGKFSGSVASGATTTVALGIQSADFITVTGTIKDDSGGLLSGALVTFSNTSTGVIETALTNASGTYSMNINKGSYKVTANLAGYVPGQIGQMAAFNSSTAGYDFGGSSPDQLALTASSDFIKGVLNNANGSPMADGYVWAENTAGLVVTAPVNSSDGSYTLPVTDGTWTIKAVGPQGAETTKSGTVTVSGGATSNNNNFNLTSDSTNAPTSTSGMVAGNTGGSISDGSATGIKLTAGAGVLQAGTGNVTINLEKTYTAPDTQTLQSLGNATFEITASGNSAIKNLNGNAEIQIKYSDLVADLPAGVTEGDLKLVYFSPERNDYVPVEGGFTVDPTNDTITGLVDHFTNFVIAYAPPASSGGSGSPSVSVSPVVSSGGGGAPTPSTISKLETPKTVAVIVPAPVAAPGASFVAPTAPLVASNIENENSTVKIAKAPTNIKAGAKLAFKYSFTNKAIKAVTLKITRQLLTKQGKIITQSNAAIKLKPGATFSKSVSETLGKTLKPGDYRVRVKVVDASKNKVLDLNSFVIKVDKAVKATLSKVKKK